MYVCFIMLIQELFPLACDDSGTSVAHRISKLCWNILESRVSILLLKRLYQMMFWSVRHAFMHNRAFSITGPSLWNNLAPEIRSLKHDQYLTLSRLLKTSPFDLAKMGSASE